MMRTIGHIIMKMAMIVACSIIMLHAIVPHHHHDFNSIGFVYENELQCHCDSDSEHEHTHHPLDLCLLQDLLSHLVLSNKEDETYLALTSIPVHNLWAGILADETHPFAITLLETGSLSFPRFSPPIPLKRHFQNLSLRAPPLA